MKCDLDIYQPFDILQEKIGTLLAIWFRSFDCEIKDLNNHFSKLNVEDLVKIHLDIKEMIDNDKREFYEIVEDDKLETYIFFLENDIKDIQKGERSWDRTSELLNIYCINFMDDITDDYCFSDFFNILRDGNIRVWKKFVKYIFLNELAGDSKVKEIISKNGANTTSYILFTNYVNREYAKIDGTRHISMEDFSAYMSVRFDLNNNTGGFRCIVK
ncbi:MAG: hypothetical protein DRG78_00050 [Epsilonproteobacteria bacterium]|nr:MAG: hypothetical protein DRG78_00050 [Campylobacterota bacterium]